MNSLQGAIGFVARSMLGLMALSTATTARAERTEISAVVSQDDVARSQNASDIKCKIRPVKVGHGARAPGQPNADAAVDAPDCQTKDGVRQQIPAASQLSMQTSSSGGFAAPFLTTTNQNMFYSGGPLVKSGMTHDIYVNCPLTNAWACWGDPYQFQVDLFASNFIKIIDQYIGSTATNRYTADSTYVKVTKSMSSLIYDTDVRTMVATAMRTRFPTGGGGGYTNVYNIFLPQGQNVCVSFGVCYSPDIPSWFYFCGYHSQATMLDATGVSTTVVYNVLPYGNVAGCQVPAGSPNGQIADSTNDILSHEILEAFTDPDLSTGWYYRGTTYNGLQYPEIADLCAHDLQLVSLNTRPYLIQSEYSNATGACVTTPPVPAALSSPTGGAVLTGLSQTFS